MGGALPKKSQSGLEAQSAAPGFADARVHVVRQGSFNAFLLMSFNASGGLVRQDSELVWGERVNYTTPMHTTYIQLSIGVYDRHICVTTDTTAEMNESLDSIDDKEKLYMRHITLPNMRR